LEGIGPVRGLLGTPLQHRRVSTVTPPPAQPVAQGVGGWLPANVDYVKTGTNHYSFAFTYDCIAWSRDEYIDPNLYGWIA
jgi:hypothetical protein